MHTTCSSNKELPKSGVIFAVNSKNASWKIRHNKNILRLKTSLVFMRKV